jgi:DNA-binding MarR family transcriptional regulator
MDKKKAGKDIMELFIQAVHQYNALEKFPVKISAKHDLYHSERHLIDRIGDHPGVNITEFARSSGKTKGAISQVVKKLETKGLVRRYKGSGNEKEVFLELTAAGRNIHHQHQRTNEETVRPLLDELKKYPDGTAESFVSLFKWIVKYLEQSGKDMKDIR